MPRPRRLEPAGVALHVVQRGNNRAACFFSDVDRRYVRVINEARSRTGTLWEGRFKSNLIDSETYLLRCHRYIEFNPVRAGMVTAPDACLWSSHRYYAKGVPSRVITEHPVYRGLGATPEACRHRYLSLCAEPMDALELSKLRTAVNKGRALGSEAFLARLEESLGRRVRPARTGRPPKVPADSVQEGGRQAEMLL